MGNSSSCEQPATRVFACSDLHVDHKQNWELVRREVEEGGYTGRDVLIVAGDVSTELALLRRTLTLLAGVFHGQTDRPTHHHHDDDDDDGDDAEDEEEEEDEEEDIRKRKRAKRGEVRMSNVFFCPGNNELRLSRADKREGITSSLEKMERVMSLCEEIGVHTRPAQVNGGQAWVVPLMGWYTPAFDPQWREDDHAYRRGWLDFRACAWPQELDGVVGGVSSHFLSLNEERLRELSLPLQGPVISFSHFLPRFELLPMRMLLHNKTLPLVVGDELLDEQIRMVGSQVHVFGHTHINKDTVIDGVRYVQNALGHPAERNKPWHLLKGRYRLKLVYSTDHTDKVEESEE